MSGRVVCLLMVFGVLFVAGTAASIELDFTVDKLIVNETGTAEFVISDASVSEDVRIEVFAVGIEVDAPDSVFVEPGVATSNYISVGVHGDGDYLVTLIAHSSDDDASSTLIVSTQADQGIKVVATPKDYDGDEYEEDVHVYVHEQGNSDVAIPDAEITIDGEFVGRTNEQGMLKANDFTKGDHHVNATFSNETDTTAFEAVVPPIVYMDINVEIEAFNGSEYNDAYIHVNIYFDDTSFTGAHAAIDMDEDSKYLQGRHTGEHGWIKAVDMPQGHYDLTVEWSGSLLNTHFTLVAYENFFSFGDMDPNSVIVDAEEWANDKTWTNDVNVTVANAYGPITDMTVKIPTDDGGRIQKTDDAGVAEFINLPEGDFTAQAYENGTAIEGAEDDFHSEGVPRDWFIVVTTDVQDDDGDGYLDDVVISLNDPNGISIKGATIWVDGTRIGLTGKDGTLLAPDMDYGEHTVVAEKVIHALYEDMYEDSVAVMTYGQPDIRLEQNIVDMVVEPGSIHRWIITFTRKISDAKLIGNIQLSLSYGNEVVEEKIFTALMHEPSIITSFRVDIPIPNRTGDHILEALITSGEI